MVCWTARGENVAAECEDADRLDRGPTHLHKQRNATHTLTLHFKAWACCLKKKVSCILREMTKAKAFSSLHVEEALCKHISSDPVRSYIYCQKIVIPCLC